MFLSEAKYQMYFILDFIWSRKFLEVEFKRTSSFYSFFVFDIMRGDDLAHMCT